MIKKNKNFQDKYFFNTHVLETILKGKSVIDFHQGFLMKNAEEVDQYLKSYGYDLNNPIEKAEVIGNFHESLHFIRHHFLYPENPHGLKLEVPRKIQEITDVRELFLMNQVQFRQWACCVLKVMHTITHMDQDVRAYYFSDIQKQIFDRFYKNIQRDLDGNLFLGENAEDPLRVDLVAFETKPKKSRDSTILKLLHKPENSAEDIFDRVGIRFITHSIIDGLRVIKFLCDRKVIMTSNIKPSRSKNTLIHFKEFESKIGNLLNQLENHTLNEQSFLKEFEKINRPSEIHPENPHSSEFYKAIQFTGRILIKLKNPVFEELLELKSFQKEKNIPDELKLKLKNINLKSVQREIRFFYPFEVQIMDDLSAKENEKGLSAHSEYKRAQIMTAMKRVMGSLIDGSI